MYECPLPFNLNLAPLCDPVGSLSYLYMEPHFVSITLKITTNYFHIELVYKYKMASEVIYQ